jgi:hypothetical protein
MTAVVLRWPRHIRENCPPGRDQCIEGRCPLCSGGLFYCRVCGGGEGELPTDCPGERMHPDQAAAVYNGHVDYVARRGGWVALEDAGEPLEPRHGPGPG